MGKIRIIILTISIAYFILFAAPSSASNWYVRPSGGSYGNEDGTSYADAWDGFDNVTWGSGGVNTGDTLYIAGIHNQQMIVGQSSITIRGDYPGDSGILDNGTGDVYSIIGDGRSNLTFYGLSFQNEYGGIRFDTGTIASGITIDNCSFTAMSNRGILFGGGTDPNYQENITLKNSQFVNIGTWGDTSASSFQMTGRVRNTLIENCSFSGNSSNLGVDGIGIQGVDNYSYNHVIRNCTFSGFEENGVDLKGGVPADSSRSKIYNCTFTDNYSWSIVIHFGARSYDIYRNSFHDTAYAIGFVEHIGETNDHGDINFYYNLFYNIDNIVLSDAYASAYGHNNFLNNTIYNAGFSETLNYSIRIKTDYWNIKNNIFYELSIGKSPYCSIHFISPINMGTINADYNIHKLSSGTYIYRYPDDSYKEIAIEPNGIAGDPLFKSTSDFRLQATSPGINNGTNVSLTSDYLGLGVPVASGYDIGAYEFCDDCMWPGTGTISPP